MAEISRRIEVDPKRCHGKPVIAGTRVMVRTVLGRLPPATARNELPSRIALASRTSARRLRSPASLWASGTTFLYRARACDSD